MLPEHSPFSPDQRKTLDALIAGFSPAQRFWIAGFLSTEEIASSNKNTPTNVIPLTVLYGSESGNSEKLADLSVKEAKKRGFKATAKNMADIMPADLAKMENLIVIVSTWGDGEPPDTATSFYKELMSATLSLPKLRYTVCALGDSSYTQFCQTGKEVDARLEAFGATRLTARQDCDLDYEDLHRAWLDTALSTLSPTQTNATAAFSSFVSPSSGSEYDKKKPFPGELTEKALLNGKGTAKETWHYEISLEGSGLNYEPGDALGVIPINAPDIVAGLLKASKLTGTEHVEVSGHGSKILSDALREDFDITALTRPVLTKLQTLFKSKKLAELLDEKSADKLKDYLWGRWIVDAIKDFAPKGISALDLASILRKLPPRLYSIASSPLAHPGEVHLTVASVRYQSHGLDRKGITSTYLADLVRKGDKVPVYTHENKNFRLPTSGETPIIMVGPGTGVAPFRAFVEHRAELGQSGKSWLFFGDQRYTYDFLYQLEWQEHLTSGALSKLDVAFSRDQPEKVYVQNRILDKAKELYAWLENGAHFYVCGDASRMANDVHEALITVVEMQGKKTRESAEIYVEDLKKTKRYQRDVY